MTIGVFAGCRYLRPGRWWWPALDAVREEHGITEVWHGACSEKDKPAALRGGDLLADQWARARGLEVRMFPAPWELYRRAGLDPKAAGMRRVADMLAGQRGYQLAEHARGAARVVTTESVPGRVGLVVCLPGGSGTQGTARQGERLGLPVVRVPMVHPPGSPRVINAHHFAMPGARDRRPPLPELWRYIGRSPPLGPSPLANPFTKAQHGLGALELYRRWLWSRIKARDAAVLDTLRSIEPGEHLVCHCKRPDGSGACHGDIVVLAWEWLRSMEDAARKSA